MLKTVIEFVLISSIFVFAVYAYCIRIGCKNNRTSLFSDLHWVLERTTALDAFLCFMMYSVFVISTAVATISHISKHSLISLDILFFFSMVVLVLFHILKESQHPLLKII